MKRPLIVFFLMCYGWKIVKCEDGFSVDCDLFKVRTEDTSEACGYKENDTTKYTRKLKGLLGNQPVYEFNTGVKFVELLYNNSSVWKHESDHHRDKYPSELEIDPFNKTLWVKFGDLDFYTFKFEDNKWKLSIDLSYGSCKPLTTRDYNDASGASAPVSTSAEEKAEKRVEEEESERSEDSKEEVVEVEKTEETVEAGDAGEEKADAEKDAAEPGGAKSLEGTSGKLAKEEKADPPLTPLDKSKFTFHTLDQDGNIQQINTSQYTLTEDSGLLQVDFVDGANLHKVDYDGLTVWSDSKYPCTGFPKTLYLNLNDNYLWVQSDSRMHIFQRYTNGWEVVESDSESQVLEESAKEAATEVVPDLSADAGADAEPATVVEVNEHEDTAKADASATTVALEGDAATVSEEAHVAPLAEAADANTVAVPADESLKAGEPDDESLESEGGEAAGDDLLLSNLYPSDHSGSHYCALRGSEVDEELEAKEAEAAPEQQTNKLKPLCGRYKMLGTKADGQEAELGNDDFEVDGDDDHLKVKLNPGVKMKELQFKRNDYDSFTKYWEHDQDKHGDSHPKVLDFGVRKALVTVEFGARWYYKYNYGDMRPELAEFKAPLDSSKKPALKLFKLDDDNAVKEMEPSDYHLVSFFDSANGRFHRFEFDEGTKLVKLEYNGEELWNHDPVTNAVNYPKYVAVNAVRKNVRVFLDDQVMFDFEFDSINNKYKSDASNKGYKVESGKLEHSGKHLKVFTLADDEVTEEEDKTDKFEVELNDSVLVGKFKEGSKCVKLEYDGKEVWKHDKAKHGTKYPSEVRFNTENLEVSVTLEDKSRFTFKHDSDAGTHSLSHSFVPLEISERPNKLKFYKDESANDEIVDADLMLAREFDGKATFLVHTFINSVKCHLVKYDNEDLWMYLSEYDENYPTTLYYNPDDHEVRVFLTTTWYYFYKFDSSKNEHDIYREREPAELATKDESETPGGGDAASSSEDSTSTGDDTPGGSPE